MNITNTTKSLPLPPGKLGLPIIGQNRVFQQNSSNYREYLYQKYGAIAKTRIFGQKYIYLRGYEAIKFVLANENKYFVNTTFPNSKKIFGETHIGMLTGEKHKERRRLLAQALKNKALSEYVDTINNLSQSYLEKWTQSDAIDLYAEFNNYTLDLFLKLLLGIDFGSQTQIDNYLKIMGSGLIGIPIPLPWTKFGQALETKKQLFTQIEQIIIKRQEQKNFDSDILGILLTVQEQIDDTLTIQEITEQLVNLLSLGRKELASALTSFLILTTQHLDVLALLKAEQEKLNKLDIPYLAKLKQMVYLEQVIKEVLRQAPPVGAVLRKVIQDCSLQGWKLPKGWTVMCQINSILQDPELYKQPEIFNPERFNCDNAEDKKQPFCFVPFGGGVRECIGKEFAYLVLKIFVSNLINNYTWEFKPNQDLTINKFPVSRPASKVEAYFSKR